MKNQLAQLTSAIFLSPNIKIMMSQGTGHLHGLKPDPLPLALCDGEQTRLSI